jgi:hypothetical protein
VAPTAHAVVLGQRPGAGLGGEQARQKIISCHLLNKYVQIASEACYRCLHGKWTCTLRIQRAAGRHPRRVAPGPALSRDADGHRRADASRTAGRGSPPATPQYAAQLLLGTMAAPQQSQTLEAIRCYADLRPTAVAPVATRRGCSSVRRWPAATPSSSRPLVDRRSRGCPSVRHWPACCNLACADETRAIVASELFGVWINRGCPVASLQFSSLVAGPAGRHQSHLWPGRGRRATGLA